MRIDAAAGFVSRGRFAYPWLGPAEHMQRDFTSEQLQRILIRNRFDGCLAVPLARASQDLEWLLDLAVTESWIKGVLGISASPGLWDSWQKRGPICGILLRPTEFASVAEAARRGLACDLDVRTGDLHQVLRLAESHPEARLAVTHMARPSFQAEDFRPWAEAMEMLGCRSRVCVKISRLINEAGPGGWKADWYRPWVRHLLNVFGAQRLMYGSDWPQCMQTWTWKESLAAFTQAIGAQPMAARESLLGGTATEFYGLSTTLTSLK